MCIMAMCIKEQHIHVTHASWTPEGREGRSQGGLKGRRLEVGARRAPKLLVIIYFIYVILSAHQDEGRCSLYQTHPHDPVIPFADFLKQCPRLPNHLHNPHNQDDPLNH